MPFLCALDSANYNLVFHLKPQEKNIFISITSYLCIFPTSSVFLIFFCLPTILPAVHMMLISQGQQNELMNNNAFVLSGILANDSCKLRTLKYVKSLLATKYYFWNVSSQNSYEYKHLNVWFLLYIDHLYPIFSIFWIQKIILYDLTFVFRIKQIDKYFVIFISYETKSNIIVVIFREWLVLSHLYVLLFSIWIIFHIFWLFITTTHTIDWL